MKKRVAGLVVTAGLLGACAGDFFATSVPDGSVGVDQSYYAFNGQLPIITADASRTAEITLAFKAFNTDGKLRVCGAYIVALDGFERKDVIATVTRRRSGIVFGKDKEAVAVPLDFIMFNDANSKLPLRAGCSRTEVAWKESFSEPPEPLRLPALPMRTLPRKSGV